MKQGSLFDPTPEPRPAKSTPAVRRLTEREALVEQIIRDCRVMEEIEDGTFLTDIPEFFEGRIASYSERVAEIDQGANAHTQEAK